MILVIVFGFGNSHTAPPALALSILIILIGLIWMTIEWYMRFKNPSLTEKWKCHLIGIFLHVLLVVYLLP